MIWNGADLCKDKVSTIQLYMFFASNELVNVSNLVFFGCVRVKVDKQSRSDRKNRKLQPLVTGISAPRSGYCDLSECRTGNDLSSRPISEWKFPFRKLSAKHEESYPNH